MTDPLILRTLCSPRMRGWPGGRVRHGVHARVFPAHAGMARARLAQGPLLPGVPRACGDGPLNPLLERIARMCSPRMRGWPDELAEQNAAERVFPAHAGMARRPARPAAACRRVPRACGDGPLTEIITLGERLCSPRMRGWPDSNDQHVHRYGVFPAHAGMARW